MSSSGLPGTATTSASLPDSIEPSWSSCPRSCAATIVAERIACIGVMPNFVSYVNSRASLRSHGNPPTSVPNAIFTPFFSARWKESW